MSNFDRNCDKSHKYIGVGIFWISIGKAESRKILSTEPLSVATSRHSDPIGPVRIFMYFTCEFSTHSRLEDLTNG